ncbi:flagellar motor switch protein FliM [Gluconacetobacter diazotrophicus PA1 5]|uniref:Flagellar motor switch protein FliM n=2 Tax=Gluconacetobacter diazotrophicus TaxID=33996 RepID=A9HHK3_GLUDA|nr:flagellar motor switch protein FliM [Gluconacetobacter diazotrophicus]ACI53207.1 flagellar motor switch protein FliM [Gluconacetobacter diazotrophicus PA1 5]MBB2156042.1 flagellar motor switch protein FliM [Gluconacetobacter diazotrophicus]CAP55645.1 putative flagellar motor switch protein fliM [Gluconacetobacter diazotrophicus PA1 5]
MQDGDDTTKGADHHETAAGSQPEPVHEAAPAGAGGGHAAKEDSSPAMAHDDMGGHVLDQSEIDSLLGNAFGGLPIKEESGLERVIKAGFVAYERLPMLEIVFDRLVRMLSSTLRSFTNDNVEITIDGMRSMSFGDYMNAVPSSSLFAVFKAVQWENYGLIVIDSALSYSIIDILMGGPRGVGYAGVEARPHTAIERALIEKLVTLTLNDLSTAFNPVCTIDLTFERLEVSARFAAIARASNAVVMTKLHIDMEDRSGSLDLIIPYVTLEPVRDQLSQQFMGERFGRDSKWEGHLVSEILETDIQVSAVFEEKTILLSEVLGLRPGMLISFPHQNGTPIHVRLQCGQTPLFEGRLGKLQDKAAVKIEKRLVPPAGPHMNEAAVPDPAPPDEQKTQA